MRIGTPLVVGLLMIVTLYVLQTLAITAVHLLVRSELRARSTGSWLRTVLIAGQVLGAITVAQVAQIAAWAALFLACGEFDDFASAFYHSAVNFTTLGSGDMILSPAWRLLGPLEALTGLLMFGVSTAVLFAVIDVLIRRDPKAGPFA
jgi:Ion channel